MSLRWNLVGIALGMAALLAPQSALSHATQIHAQSVQAIRLHAHYDTGAPMAQAQVIIHAPDAPSEVWGRGVTDRDGHFDFIPDDIAGRWTVQVRQAGHGVVAHIDIGAGEPVIMVTSAQGTWLQRAVMIALVAWGALGTALFAWRKKGRPDAFA
ncbi:carboxypeptidase-like regulatory domain-containing protein [Roseinatronobacter alkalisoli]|uniref:Carboxypeptidase-like regulatory domain-containing protein n=1 Tax=Roseinatronobacter alkalisoli TaxID=3028235 RepID=A0ABT5T7Q3_9RHOB|nr:carboxypeptidase-like regulatory domain-containing protein [Roseinatronobacter sp. HJB301]MDD7971155.1 carboxypeptidase-like regulatory domain-containing protein [Roseinatronobacter sp. HJB301]